MSQLNLREVKEKIHSDKDWQSRSIDIEVFHFELMTWKKKWSIRKTAKLLNLCASTVCEDLQLSKFLLRHPELGEIKFRYEALRIMRNSK